MVASNCRHFARTRLSLFEPDMVLDQLILLRNGLSEPRQFSAGLARSDLGEWSALLRNVLDQQ